VRPRKIETLLRKEKYGPTFAILEDNPVWNKMLTDSSTMKSDASFRFTVAIRVDIPPHQQTSNNDNINQRQTVKDAAESSSGH
jgi:hypothetical protein